ncbi:unnamed protein product, partial [Ixodes persulcatus]
MGNAMAIRLMENDDDDVDLANFAASSLLMLELPERLIERVLSFVPAGDLVKACRFVCGSFGRIVEGNGLWELKCERDGKYIPNLEWHPLPPNYYRGLYAGVPYFQNLLHLASRGSREANQSCFATSYGVCSKEQVISLVKEGVVPEVLDIFKPAIEVSEWWVYAGRFDCGCMYRLIVELLDVAKKPVATFDTGELVTPQWAGRQWQQAS